MEENEVFLQWVKGQETNLEIIDESDKLTSFLKMEVIDTFNNLKDRYDDEVVASIIKCGLRQFVDSIKFNY